MNLVFSVEQTGVPLGNALAGVVLPGLALAIGWRGAALATAVLCLVVAAGAAPLRGQLDVGLERDRPLLSLAHLTGPLRLVFGSTEVRRLALTSFAYAGMQMSLGTFLVTYLNDRLGMSIVLGGVALAFAQGAGVAGRILWGFLADRFIAPMRLLGLLGLAMSACAVLVGLFTAAWPLVVILAVCGAYGGTAIALERRAPRAGRPPLAARTRRRGDRRRDLRHLRGRHGGPGRIQRRPQRRRQLYRRLLRGGGAHAGKRALVSRRQTVRRGGILWMLAAKRSSSAWMRPRSTSPAPTRWWRSSGHAIRSTRSSRSPLRAGPQLALLAFARL